MAEFTISHLKLLVVLILEMNIIVEVKQNVTFVNINIT